MIAKKRDPAAAAARVAAAASQSPLQFPPSTSGPAAGPPFTHLRHRAAEARRSVGVARGRPPCPGAELWRGAAFGAAGPGLSRPAAASKLAGPSPLQQGGKATRAVRECGGDGLWRESERAQAVAPRAGCWAGAGCTWGCSRQGFQIGRLEARRVGLRCRADQGLGGHEGDPHPSGPGPSPTWRSHVQPVARPASQRSQHQTIRITGSCTRRISDSASMSLEALDRNAFDCWCPAGWGFRRAGRRATRRASDDHTERSPTTPDSHSMHSLRACRHGGST